MTRKFEKILLFCASVWQIINGLITIFLYAPAIRRSGIDAIPNNIPLIEANASYSFISSIYMVSVIFGFLFILFAIINLLILKKMSSLKIEKKLPLYLFSIGLVSYFLMDFVSAILLISSGVIMLSKNKSILKLNLGGL